MKSKLTLRLDASVKEEAKKLACRKGTSVSQLVEDDFRLLTDESESGAANEPSAEREPEMGTPAPLPPRIQELKEQLGRPAPAVEVDDDTRAWIEAAAEKHA